MRTVPTERNHEKLLQALIRIGQDLASITDLDRLLPQILQVAQDVFAFDNALIRLLDETSGLLVPAASYGYPEEAVHQQLRLGQGVMGEVAQTGQPLLVRDLGERANYIPGIRNARCELAVPLIARDRVIGVFNVESTEADAFTREDIPPLMTLAGQAAIAIDNARLVADLTAMSDRYRLLHQLNDRILHSVNLGIYTLDTELAVTSWNATMEQASGIGASEALGKKIFSLFPRLEAEGFTDRVRRVLESGRPERFRLNHRNMMGELRIQKRRLAPLKDGERTVGVVVIIEDITEFRRLMDQTIQSEKLAEVGRMSAGIAHEINNPLAVISYGAQLVLREEGLSADLREVAERISGEAERLQTLTGSLLSFSRARGSVKRWVDPNAVVEDVVRLVRYQFQRQSLRLETELATLPHIYADDNRLKQVLINLMLNAAQAMGRDGQVRVVTSSLSSDRIAIEVIDNGPGIPPNVQPHIFEPFFSTKKEGEGTGLGLYICQNIVRDHEGEIRVATPADGGTCFTIELPVGEAE